MRWPASFVAREAEATDQAVVEVEGAQDALARWRACWPVSPAAPEAKATGQAVAEVEGSRGTLAGERCCDGVGRMPSCPMRDFQIVNRIACPCVHTLQVFW